MQHDQGIAQWQDADQHQGVFQDQDLWDQAQDLTVQILLLKLITNELLTNL